MAIHHFLFGAPKTTPPAPADNREPAPIIPFRPFNMPDVSKKTKITFNDLNVNTIEDSKDVIVPGFRTMDAGMKAFLSDIVIPTKDGTKKVEARIAGGDKSVLRWIQDYLKEGGRPRLPVISINRASAAWNPQKFSPPYHPVQMQFVNGEGSRVKFTYRPLPYLIEYQASIWAERKRDAEYILYEITSRFNPMAVVEVGDQYVQGPLSLLFNGYTDSSDVEIGAEELPKVRYDVSLSAEGWLPVSSEKIIPTVLGRAMAIHDEDTGTLLENIDNIRNVP
jgi:hypothetical protein